jgi:hypothetical protein
VTCSRAREINRVKAELLILEAVEQSLLDIQAGKGSEVRHTTFQPLIVRSRFEGSEGL